MSIPGQGAPPGTSQGPAVLRKVTDALEDQAKNFWAEETQPAESHEARISQRAEWHKKRQDGYGGEQFQPARKTRLFG